MPKTAKAKIWPLMTLGVNHYIDVLQEHDVPNQNVSDKNSVDNLRIVAKKS
jgi:hypothetical protein